MQSDAKQVKCIVLDGPMKGKDFEHAYEGRINIPEFVDDIGIVLHVYQVCIWGDEFQFLTYASSD